MFEDDYPQHLDEAEETVASGPDKDNLRLWVAGLRSDRFAQGLKALTLRMPDGTLKHCCLGVACQIALENGLKMEVADALTVGSGTPVVSYDDETMTLPLAVVNWLGLIENSDVALRFREDDPDDSRIASELNDDERWDFGQIADAIERTFELNEVPDGQ